MYVRGKNMVIALSGEEIAVQLHVIMGCSPVTFTHPRIVLCKKYLSVAIEKWKPAHKTNETYEK